MKSKMEAKATRVNKPQQAHAMAYESDRANVDTKGNSVFTARVRGSDEALPVTFSRLADKGTYTTGMGEARWTR